MSLHPSVSSTHYTNDLREAIPSDQAFKIPGKHKDNTFKAIKTHDHNNKGSDKPLSTLPLPLNPGTISGFQWTLIGQEPPEGTGKDEEGDNPGGMLPELTMSEPKGEYRVHVLTVENKATLLTIAPQNRNTPTLKQPS